MKKFLCVVTAILIIFIPCFTITAFAYENDKNAAEELTEYVELLLNSGKNICGASSSGNLYNYIKSTGQAAKYKYLLFNVTTFSQLFPKNAEYPYKAGITSNIQFAHDAVGSAYNAVLVNRDIVESLYECIDGYSEDRGYPLTHYGITTSCEFDVNHLLGYYGSPFTIRNSGADQYNGYYDLTNVYSSSKVCICYGENAVPAMYVPQGCVVYENGIQLTQDALYFLCSDNYLLAVAINRNYGNCYSPYCWAGGSGDVNSWQFQCLIGSTPALNNGSYLFSPPADSPYLDAVIDGSWWHLYPDYAYGIDAFEKAIGVYVGGFVSDEPPVYTPPANIPYDDDGNVVMIMPQGDTYSDDDIIYIAPDQYKEYVDNGDFIEGDIVNNFGDEITNNIYNDYVDYISNSYGTDTTDPRLINKLDRIIQWLSDIYNKIDNIRVETTNNYFTVNEEMQEIFSSEPVYENFSDCIVENVPIVQSVSDLVDSMNTQEADNGFSEIVYEAPQEPNQLQSLYDGYHINVNWYIPYRLRVRTFLKIPIWIFAIGAIWHNIKSAFGLQSSGGD